MARGKGPILVVTAALLLLAGGLAWWWTHRGPQDAHEALLHAEALEAAYLRTTDPDPAASLRRRQAVVDAYRAVFERFPPRPVAPPAAPEVTAPDDAGGETTDGEPPTPHGSPAPRPAPYDPDHARAHLRLAEFHDRTLKDAGEAARWYRAFIDKYPAAPEREAATLRLAELLEGALDRPREAVDAYRGFARDFAASGRAPEALLRAARLLSEGRVPDAVPSEILELLDEIVDRFPAAKEAAEALFLKGRRMETVEEFQAALGAFRALHDRFPDHTKAQAAREAIARILGERLDRHEEAARAWKEVARKAPSGREAEKARAQEEMEREQSSRKEEEEYHDRRYGGAPGADPYASRAGSIAPHEHWAAIIGQQIDIERIHVAMAIDFLERRCEVTADLDLKNDGDPKKYLTLVLDASYRIDEVRRGIEPEAPALPFRQHDETDLVVVTLAGTWATGERLSLRFRYAGAPEEGNLNVQFGPTGYAMAPGGWYPFTFYGDTFEAAFELTLPAGSVALPGERLSPETEDAAAPVRHGWRSPEPVFGIYLAYGPYRLASRPVSAHGLRLAYREEAFEPRAADWLAVASEALLFYTQRFGPHGYGDVAIVEADLPPMLGGVGAPGLVFVNATSFAEDAEEAVPANLLAHELAHQWWGNRVPCSVKEGYAPWLSEGFASYSDALFTEHREGREALDRHLASMAELYFERVLFLPDEPVATCRPESPIYRAVVYEKGAWALHTLRGLLGDPAFFRTMSRYATEHATRPSSVDGFLHIAAETGETDLSVYAEEILRRPGFPHLEIVDVQSMPTGPDGGRTVDLIVAHRNEVYRTPIVVRLTGGGLALDRRLLIDEPRKTLRLALPFQPEHVELDPAGWLLKNPRGDHRWPRTP